MDRKRILEDNMSRHTAAVLALITLIAVFYGATLRPGHSWGDDFAEYIGHARNLAEGRPYGDTGYVYNPSYPWLGPPTYPPVYPLLLAPVYRLFGLDLAALKLAGVLCLAAALAAVYLAFKSELAWPESVALVLAVGLNPVVWGFKDEVASDLPFTFFMYLTLVLARRAQAPGGNRAIRGLLTGLALYAAYGTRSVGLLLLPALWLEDLLRERRPAPATLVASAVFAVAALLQNLLVHDETGYARALIFNPNFFPHYLLGQVRNLALFWDNGYSNAGKWALFALLAVPAAAGYAAQVRRHPGAREIFPVLYTAALLLLPTSLGTRSLIPLVPLFLFYALDGLRRLAAWLRRPGLAHPAALALLALTGVAYAGAYTRADFGPIRPGITDDSAQGLFAYVRAHTTPDDVCVFRKPRALALFTGCRAAIAHAPAEDVALWDYFEATGVTFVVLSPTDAGHLGPFVERYPERFTPEYANAEFRVFRVRGPGTR